jgi:hypothetical protein
MGARWLKRNPWDRMKAAIYSSAIVWPVLAAAGLLIGLSAADATSIHFPKFSKPILQQDHLVFMSPDSKRVLCVGLNGEKLWEKSYDQRVQLFADAHSNALLQVGKAISSVRLNTGDLDSIFSVEDESDLVTYSPILEAFVSRDRRFDKRSFKVLDEQSGRARWKTTEIDNVVCAIPDLFVASSVETIPSGGGFRFGKMSLQAFDRKSFTQKWRVPLADENGSPWLTSAFKSPYLIYVESQTTLVVLDCTTGRKLLTRQVDVPKYGRIIGVTLHDDHIAWFTSALSHREDFNNTEHPLHFCSIPDLKETAAITLRLIEIAQVSFEGGFIISDALYRTACFRPEGSKIWERFQCNRTSVIDGRFYFSDYNPGTTRIGFVEVASGKETILYQEKIEENQKP